ncbi:hypothetical protein E2562_004460 [Oryza meyeriana var. granulata]|uniref:Uncharacterized protein n=1 Tax=Oryza meyeriana var. granulata TaxID=110450 RepID=A0A6G1CXZ0_9ORYZ|nr:hypothetical protein E2562_004460 [Oryza meyeriana var. granulata]
MVEVLVEEEEASPRCKKEAMAAIAAGLPGHDKYDLETRAAAAGAGDDGESRHYPKVVIN